MKLSQAGITLAEIVITLAIAGVGGFLIVGLLTSTSNVFVDQTIQVNQGISSNQAELEITDLIKSSAGVVNQYPASGAPQFTTGAEVLVLKLPSVSANGQVIDSVFDYAVLSKDPGSKILRKRVFANAQSTRNNEDKVLSTSLDSLRFVYLDVSNNPVSPAQSVRVSFTVDLSDSAGLSENENSVSSTVNLKNL